MPGGGFCNVADEINRMFAASRIACRAKNGINDDFGPIMDSSLMHILRNRFGYVNAQFLSTVTDTQVLIEQIANKASPIIEFYSGHAWLLDSYRNTSGIKYFHQLEGSNSGCSGTNFIRHPAMWKELSNLHIINLDPTISLTPSGTISKQFYFGEVQEPYTAGAITTFRLRVRAPGNAASSTIRVRIVENHWNGASWNFYKEHIAYSDLLLSTSGAVTDEFTFGIPKVGSIQLNVEFQNLNGANAALRMVFEEPSPRRKLTFSRSDTSRLEILQEGSIKSPVGLHTRSHTPGGSLSFRYLPTNTVYEAVEANGNFYSPSFQINSGNCLDSISQCKPGSIVFTYNDDVKMAAFTDSGGPVVTRKNYLENVTRKPLYLKNLSSTGYAVYPSDPSTNYQIYWDRGTGSSTQYVNSYYQIVGQTAWHSIFQNIAVSNATYSWSIPEALVDSTIRLGIQDAHNSAVNDITTVAIAIQGRTMKIHLPSLGTIIYRGHTIQIKWEFHPQTMAYVLASKNGRTFEDISEEATRGEDFTWTVPSDWPSSTIMFKVQSYSEINMNVKTGNFTVQ